MTSDVFAVLPKIIQNHAPVIIIHSVPQSIKGEPCTVPVGNRFYKKSVLLPAIARNQEPVPLIIAPFSGNRIQQQKRHNVLPVNLTCQHSLRVRKGLPRWKKSHSQPFVFHIFQIRIHSILIERKLRHSAVSWSEVRLHNPRETPVQCLCQMMHVKGAQPLFSTKKRKINTTVHSSQRRTASSRGLSSTPASRRWHSRYENKKVLHRY